MILYLFCIVCSFIELVSITGKRTIFLVRFLYVSSIWLSKVRSHFFFFSSNSFIFSYIIFVGIKLCFIYFFTIWSSKFLFSWFCYLKYLSSTDIVLLFSHSVISSNFGLDINLKSLWWSLYVFEDFY